MTGKAEAKKEIESLRQEIRRHEPLYYVLDVPIVIDEGSDRLKQAKGEYIITL